MDLDALLQLASPFTSASEGDVRARKSKEEKASQKKEKKLRKEKKKVVNVKKDEKKTKTKKHKSPKKFKKRSRDCSSTSYSSSDDSDRDRDSDSGDRSKKASKKWAKYEKSIPLVGPACREVDPTPKSSAMQSLLHIPPQKGATAPKSSSVRNPKPLVNALYFKCATCGVEVSGVSSFVEHINGSKHRKLNAGRAGFSGLVPNRAGTIPPLTDPLLRAAALRFNPAFAVDGTDAAGQALPSKPNLLRAQTAEPLTTSGPWAPPTRRVDVPAHTLAAVQYFLGGAAGSSNGTNSPRVAVGSGSGSDSERKDVDDHESEAEVGTAKAERSRRKRDSCSHCLTPPRLVVPKGGPFRRQRESLPVFAHREALLHAVGWSLCLLLRFCICIASCYLRVRPGGGLHVCLFPNINPSHFSSS